MFDRIRDSKAASAEGLGAFLVFAGLVMFIAVFFVVFPVLTDPVGAYDDWFPDEDPGPVAADSSAEDVSPAEPTAAFRFVANSTFDEPVEGGEGQEEEGQEEPSATYFVTFEDRSELGDAEIVSWSWDFGDGREGTGQFVEHTYEEPGAYPVRLDIEDENGETSRVEGDVEVPEEGRSSDRFDAADDIDLSGLEAAVEDAVVALEDSVDETLDSVGSAARSTSIVVLFALAAIAATVVAWRVTRSGIMLLRPSQDVRLKVKSADMHVDVGREPLREAIAVASGDGETATDLSTDLVEV